MCVCVCVCVCLCLCLCVCVCVCLCVCVSDVSADIFKRSLSPNASADSFEIQHAN